MTRYLELPDGGDLYDLIVNRLGVCKGCTKDRVYMVVKGAGDDCCVSIRSIVGLDLSRVFKLTEEDRCDGSTDLYIYVDLRNHEL